MAGLRKVIRRISQCRSSLVTASGVALKIATRIGMRSRRGGR